MDADFQSEIPFDRLERCIHEPARLALLSLLVNTDEGLRYGALRDELNLTYGNLERHMKVLIEAGLVEVQKVSSLGRPQSVARLSDAGRAQFLDYLANLEKILQAARGNLSVRHREDPGLPGQAEAAPGG